MGPLIPYFDTPIYELGPLVLDPWAALVCFGFILGLEISRARGIRLGADVRDVVDGGVVTVGVGFLVGHIVHVAAYNPQLIHERGWIELLRVWGGFSSTGGFLGAIIGSVLFYKLIRKRDFWTHADIIAFGFPFGWVFGRLGCFLSHDHIGRRTDFFLAVDFPASSRWGGARHDLGLYEAIWTAGICAVFWALRDRPVRPGFFVALFALLYAPARFGLDFLRQSDQPGADVRWAGLTPAQWGMLAMAAAGAVVVWQRRNAEIVAPPDDAGPSRQDAPPGEDTVDDDPPKKSEETR